VNCFCSRCRDWVETVVTRAVEVFAGYRRVIVRCALCGLLLLSQHEHLPEVHGAPPPFQPPTIVSTTSSSGISF
jgi:hypothetical protein